MASPFLDSGKRLEIGCIMELPHFPKNLAAVKVAAYSCSR
jgi:hypothetical protein